MLSFSFYKLDSDVLDKLLDKSDKCKTILESMHLSNYGNCKCKQCNLCLSILLVMFLLAIGQHM